MQAKRRQENPIKAGEVLDARPEDWSPRLWTSRRELTGANHAFCDVAASHALAKLSAMGGRQPSDQQFLLKGDLQVWRGTFQWGMAWCASRDGEFWAWVQGDGVRDARVEIAGNKELWDDDLAEAFAQSLLGAEMDK